MVGFSAPCVVVALVVAALVLASGPVHAEDGVLVGVRAQLLGPACTGVVTEAFVDVDPTSTHAHGIACVPWWGITQGVDGVRFAPASAVTRGQLATFVARLLHLTGAQRPDEMWLRFDDVADSVHLVAILQLAVLEAAGRLPLQVVATDRDSLATWLELTWQGRGSSSVISSHHKTLHGIQSAGSTQNGSTLLVLDAAGTGYLGREVVRDESGLFETARLEQQVRQRIDATLTDWPDRHFADHVADGSATCDGATSAGCQSFLSPLWEVNADALDAELGRLLAELGEPIVPNAAFSVVLATFGAYVEHAKDDAAATARLPPAPPRPTPVG